MLAFAHKRAVCLVTAIVGVANLGCAGSDNCGGQGVSPIPSTPAPSKAPATTASVTGRWGLLQQYAESDGVILDEHAGSLSGTGCSGHLAPEGSAEPIPQDCGPISGSVDQGHVTFAYQVDFGGGASFAADVYLSADGRRMAGRFFTSLSKTSLVGPSWLSEPTAWGRLDTSESWFARIEWPSGLDDAWSSVGFGYDLTLVDDPKNGADFSGLVTYRMAQLGSGLVGGLGAFLPKELAFTRSATGETTTITAGPVPETAPGLPVAVKLDLQGGALLRAQASMASGETYWFTAAKRTSR